MGEEKCPAIPPGPTVLNYRPRIESLVGSLTRLDAHELFNITEGDFSYQWQQVYMTPYEVEYVTNHQAELIDPTSATTSFVPKNLGNYRFRLSTTDEITGSTQSYELDVLVTKESERTWDVNGVIFPDLFGELGGPEFNVAPGDPECLARVLDHAMSAPLRVGANWVGIVSAAFYTQVDPLPIFDAWGNDLSLTNETFFAALVGAAKQRDLKVMQTESLALGLDLSSDQIDAYPTMINDPTWWEEWFTQWENWLIPRAARAEKYGVDMFVLYLYPDVDSFQPDTYPQYGARWSEIITEVRNVYSGMVALNVINADERLSAIVDDLDALLITVFGGLYTSSGRLKDVRNPTIQELVNITEDYLDMAQNFAEKLHIYYVLTISSSDGQQASEDPEWLLAREKGLDFQEQVLYYEAFFKALEDESWVSGVFTERWDWFDQYHRSGDTYEAKYFDATREASPRSKPAEIVVKLWYSIY